MKHVLNTERLILRRFEEHDLEAFYKLGTIPEVIRYAQAQPYVSMDDALQCMHKWPFHDYATVGYGRFAVVWRETGEVIGFSGVKYLADLGETELGYRFLPEYWGRGLATEAGQASIDFARDVLGLKRLIGLVHPDNEGSANVLTKLGFSIEKQMPFAGLDDVQVDVFARAI
ncbi:GNAT family N-acetyltransferase [Burkholderiaceae bacterium DAT-1]|nr:GNAT family N-acetyltransferase [Burkholderiaceae bacterium DAT-1]